VRQGAYLHGPRLTFMDQLTAKPTAPETPAFTLTVAQLREIVREEIQAARAPHQDADRLLDAEEAAKVLSMSTDWLYRQAKKLPFTRKLGPKMLRFSQQGILKWLATRKLL
jgi:predicted DNA-binding transcriptional regulator AlpA